MLRREKAYEMRAVGHKSFREIADELGVALSVVHDDVKFITRLKIEGMIERDQEMSAGINEAYDAMLRRWIPVVLSDGFEVQGEKFNRKGEVQIIKLDKWDAAGIATDKITKILDQKAKLNGLYAKETQSPQEFGKEMALGVISAMRELAQSPIKPAEATEINATRPLLHQRS